MARRHDARLAFEAIAVEGALFTPDYLARVARLEAPDQAPADYAVPKGPTLRDEIGRYFVIASAHWSTFQQAREAKRPAAPATRQFVGALLRDVFGFGDVPPAKPQMADGRSYPLAFIGAGGHAPVAVGAHDVELDRADPALHDGTRARSAFLLAQDWLNASADAQWGLATNGLKLRLLRDNASLTRPAWVEADLERIFAERRHADFALLWLLIHANRFGAGGRAAGDCALEAWHRAGVDEGARARDRLREGVERALLDFGRGLLAHPDNGALRARLTDGTLTPADFFAQLLRLVYRLIFLLTVEERDLLHPRSADGRHADEGAVALYAQGYGLRRLVERAVRRAAWDRHDDLWRGLKQVFAGLERGQPLLALPALGGLYERAQCPDVDGAALDNRALLAGLFHLAWLRGAHGLARVAWRDMGPEELGSIYESLLELVPRPDAAARTFRFAEPEASRGSARKTTGSYYTPDALVQLLLDRALDPVLDRAMAGAADAQAALLALRIIDPACGSGHFLLGAARRLAARLARLRSADTPSPAEWRHAMRDVIGQCIHGVDRNPMAVELCRVALWLEAVEPGKPLNFLDAQIRCGDSLVGVFDLGLLRRGIPDAAYAPLTGDDKEAARAWARVNRADSSGTGPQYELLDRDRPPTALIDAAAALAALPDDTAEQVAAKRAAFDRLLTRDWLNLKLACDAFTAAFFAPKVAPPPEGAALETAMVPLTRHVRAALRGGAVYGPLAAEVDRIASAISAFHWPLAFPHIMAAGGFDAVIGNPPWEVSQLSEQEFFAARAPDIAELEGERRKRAIARLPESEPDVWRDYQQAKRISEAVNDFFRDGGRFNLTASGKLNTYSLFAEHFRHLAKPAGAAGVIVPTGIATDSSTAAFFGDLVAQGRLAGLYDFENRAGLFPAVDSRMKFSLLVMATAAESEFAFFLTGTDQVAQAERCFTLSAAQIARINPNTRTAPVFRSRADAELTARIYDRVPVLIEEQPEAAGGDRNPWGITFQQGLFNMTTASEHFATAAELAAWGWQRDGTDWVNGAERRVPLYEAKMIHHYDHRWATYAGGRLDDEEGARDCTLAEKQDADYEPSPRYWVPEGEVRLRAARVPAALKRGLRDKDDKRIWKALATWIAGALYALEGRWAAEADLTRLLGRRDWRAALGKSADAFLLDPKVRRDGTGDQRDVPLTADDLRFIAQGPRAATDLAQALIDRKQPRWLMGWRDMSRSTDERTLISSVFPRTGVNHKLQLFHSSLDAKLLSMALSATMSLPFDYLVRQKLGGTSVSYFYLKQIALPPPSVFTANEISFVVPRVLELTYTSHALRPWAEDLGHAGGPFAWDEERRARLRAELDAVFARKYGLSRDELRYVLDPAEVRGPDYPSETFRVLKKNEMARHGEYRTQRLVLAAWDRFAGMTTLPASTEEG